MPTEPATGEGAAHDPEVSVSEEQGTPAARPEFIPEHYVWDETLGPIEDHTGKPRGAWREPEENE